MKRLILLELALLFLATTFMTDNSPGWVQQTLPVNDQINDLYFADSLNGWVVTNGNYSTNDTSFIMHTTDAGNNWTIQEKNMEQLNAVQFLDVNTGYVVGGVNGTVMLTIYKTTNAGNNWQALNNIGGGQLSDLNFINKDTGWVCESTSGLGGLYKTTNGGLNWQQQLSSGFQPSRLFFLNKDTGFTICNSLKLYKTTNSGTNWNQIYSFQDVVIDLFYTSKDTGWIVGGRNNGVNLLHSTDGGLSWDSVNCSKHFGGLEKIFMLSSTKGWIGTSLNSIYATRDGYNWGSQFSPSAISWSIQFTDTSHGWAGRTSLVHTDDGGGPITYVGNKPNSTLVPSFQLKQNYPNPFNPSTSIDFDITRNSRISIKIYDLEGKEIDQLLDYEKFTPGSYYVQYNADDIASGVYLYQVTGWTEDNKEIFIDTKKMIYLK